MPIARLRLDIQLPGCRSLKDKRSRLRHLKDRFGASPNVAVSETAYHDRLDCAQWSFVAIGADPKLLAAQLQRIEDHVRHFVDGYIIDSERDFPG